MVDGYFGAVAEVFEGDGLDGVNLPIGMNKVRIKG